MRNLLKKGSENQRIAHVWAEATADFEQYVESLPVVTPEVTEALANSKNKWRKWQRIANQGSSSDGND